MFLEVLEITAPVFALGLVGVVWAWMKLPYEITFVSRLVLNVTLPCLVFSTLAKTGLSAQAMTEMALAALAAFALAGAAMWGALGLFGLSHRTWWSAAVFGNTGNFGLPICFFAFGETGLALAMVLFAVGVILQFSIGLRVIAGPGQLGMVLGQPMIYAATLGAVFAGMNWTVPDVALNTLSLAGQITIPLMLITLGYSIAQLHVSETGSAALVTGLRTLVLGASGVAVGLALGLEPIAFGVLVLQFVTPAAVTIYMMTARYGENAGGVAGLVLLSTILAVITVPVVLRVVI